MDPVSNILHPTGNFRIFQLVIIIFVNLQQEMMVYIMISSLLNPPLGTSSLIAKCNSID